MHTPHPGEFIWQKIHSMNESIEIAVQVQSRLYPAAGMLLLAVAAVLLTGCQTNSASPVEEPEMQLVDGWNRIAPGGETTCSDGSEYAFYARPGDPEMLLVYF